MSVVDQEYNTLKRYNLAEISSSEGKQDSNVSKVKKELKS
jgi:hypothetical protein